MVLNQAVRLLQVLYKNTMRAISFLIVITTALFFPLSFFISALFLYVIFWPGLELLLIGVYIDIQFGHAGAHVSFLYTLIVTGFLFVSLFIKPYIKFYTRRV